MFIFFCHLLLISLFVSQIKCDVQDLTSNRDHDDKVPSNPNLYKKLLTGCILHETRNCLEDFKQSRLRHYHNT